MIPFLLPICLLLYGEFSHGSNTRYVSRILFYTYTLSVLFPLYVTGSSMALLIAATILIIGITYSITLIPAILGKITLSFVLVTAVLNYVTIYLQDVTFLFDIPYYAEYSNFIFREGLILGVTASSIKEQLEVKDFSLELFIAILWFYEHLLSKGII